MSSIESVGSLSLNYAPVIIPTISRFNHLYRCIESLKNNPYAKYTDLYISLDYPASEKYVEGHSRVKEYLEQGIDGFASYHYYVQDSNLGIGGNCSFLMKTIRNLGYDKYIYTEDDNEFSPCFLEFINKGLNLFKNDKSVFMICGYTEEKRQLRGLNNFMATYAFTPWGYGMWFEDRERITNKISSKSFDGILRDDVLSRKMACNRPDLFRFLVEAVVANPKDIKTIYSRYYDSNGQLRTIDQVMSIAMWLDGCYSINPSCSMVRNIGMEDGSGCITIRNSEYNYEKQPISSETTFEYIYKQSIEKQKNTVDCKKISYPPAKRAWFIRKLYLLFGVIPARAVLYFSYYFSLYIGKVMVGVGIKKGPIVVFNK